MDLSGNYSSAGVITTSPSMGYCFSSPASSYCYYPPSPDNTAKAIKIVKHLMDSKAVKLSSIAEFLKLVEEIKGLL